MSTHREYALTDYHFRTETKTRPLETIGEWFDKLMDESSDDELIELSERAIETGRKGIVRTINHELNRRAEVLELTTKDKDHAH